MRNLFVSIFLFIQGLFGIHHQSTIHAQLTPAPTPTEAVLPTFPQVQASGDMTKLPATGASDFSWIGLGFCFSIGIVSYSLSKKLLKK